MVIPDAIVMSAGPGEMRLAVLSDGQPIEFLVDRGGVGEGDIVLGRVLSVNRSLDAAFVDIGEPLPAFLPAPGAIGEGDAVLMQITAAAFGAKGAGGTKAVSLQGALLAFTPFRPGLSLSRRIADEARRTALRQDLAPLLSAGEGVVVRTAAADVEPEQVRQELDRLRASWQRIAGDAASARAPAVICGQSMVARLLTRYPSVRHVVVDDRAALADLKALFPAAAFVARCFDDQVGEAFDLALEPRVPLPGGGWLSIERTAAAITIDIDSAGLSPSAVNLAAMAEIARQLRLRGLGGHILVDVIPRKGSQSLGPVLAALRHAVGTDPTPTHVVGATPLGMIEMTRERRHPALDEVMQVPSGVRLTDLSIALAGVKAALVQADRGRAGAGLTLRAPPAVIGLLQARQDLLAEVGRRLGRPLSLDVAPHLSLFEIVEDPS
jgi:Ribonuclease G/E